MENERTSESDVVQWIDMDRILALIRSKPKIYLLISLIYLLFVLFIKWFIHPSVDALWFFVGGALGIYFLDGAEIFFALHPSPFRSILFFALFVAVAFFVVTSSTGTIGSGLVLSLYLQFLLWQIGELYASGRLDSWYRLVTMSVNVSTQRLILGVAIAIFLVETYIFIR